MAEAEQSRRRVQSIEVGFRVLRVLRTAEGPLPLREIAARARMPSSKVHLYLVSLVREDMAYQDPQTGHYGLGAFAIQLGLAAIRQLDVVDLASDVLTGLRDRTDCAVYLSLWGDRGPCLVAKADGSLQGAFSLRLGYIPPLTTTATGMVYLAHLPPSETARAMEAQSASHEALAERVAEVQRLGYASTLGMRNRTFTDIAAPIFDYSGSIAAAMTLLGPTDYLTRPRHKEFVQLLLRATGTVSQRMGARGAGEEAA